MHQLPEDPAYFLLDKAPISTQKVHRKGCYICEDREFARMGLPLCNRCCMCATSDRGHIPADDDQCQDCGHVLCLACAELPPQDAEICTCGSQHCPTHGKETS
jgi:hypothetical protein